MVKTSQNPTRIRSVAKAVQILAHIGAARGPCTATEIATGLGLPVGTAHHLLDTLVAEGMLSKDTRRLYHLGPGIGALAAAFTRLNSAPPFLLDPLHELAAATGETVYLSRPQGGDVVLLHAIESSRAVLARTLVPGTRGDIHARAAGKVILAYRSTMLEGLLARQPLHALTPATITDEAELRQELAAIRERGHAFDHEEFHPGVSAVAAPVIEGAEAIAAYTAAAPTSRFDERRDELIDAVLAAARNASDKPPA